jgi:hypothetical protein
VPRAGRVEVLTIQTRAVDQIHRAVALVRRLAHYVVKLAELGDLRGFGLCVGWADRPVSPQMIAAALDRPHRQADGEESPAAATLPAPGDSVEVGRPPLSATAAPDDVHGAAAWALQGERDRLGEDVAPGKCRWLGFHDTSLQQEMFAR